MLCWSLCRQSVRVRASLRATAFKPATGRPGPSQFATKKFTPLPPISPESTPPPPPTRSQDPFSSPEVPRRPFPREPQTLPKKTGNSKKQKPIPPSRERSVSPELSDSDPEENYLNYTFQQFAVGPVKKRICSGSESSVGEECSAPKPPVATPRKKSPRSQSVSSIPRKPQAESPSNPPLPPRPNEELDTSPRPPLPPRPTNVPKIKKHKSLDDDDKEEKEEPARPHRPRMSEIKRAKNRARAAKAPRNKNAPSLTVVDEDGFETMSTISSKSSKSSKSYTSTKSAPAYRAGGRDVQKKRAGTACSNPDANFLTPGTTERRRTRSTDDMTHRKASPERAGEEEQLNTEVAGKLLSYIMTSEDPGLKAALRELISQDSSVASSIQGNH